MKDEWRTMNFEGWMMKDDYLKLLRGFDYGSDGHTDSGQTFVNVESL